MSVTADSTIWTADTVCVTADGRIICIPANLAEAASAVEAFDAVAIAGGAVIDADAVEAATATDELDAAIGAQVLFGTVDEAASAVDQLDALVETVELPAAVGGGARYPRRRPLPVYGVGYGVLPELWGEAHGVVGVVGKSAARLFVQAAAIGACGQAGNASAVLKAMAVAGTGAVGARGAGDGTIVKFNGTATGQHDDDEAAAALILLLAA